MFRFKTFLSSSFYKKWYMVILAFFAICVAHFYQITSRLNNDRLEFSNFHRVYNKIYKDRLEYEKRFHIFMENKAYIDQHNHKDYVLKMNQFGDMTMDEIEDIFLAHNKFDGFCSDEKNCLNFDNINESELPDELDWRLRGVVSPVKNQGRCGSCWAFAAAAALESAWAIKTNRLSDISTQQMVDCDKRSHGCGGGMMDRAYYYLMKNGVALEDEYPYKGVDQVCRSNFTRSSINITGFGYVANSSPLEMKKALSTQPITVAVAVNRNFVFYKSGIFDNECGPNLNHAVVLTGYGVNPSKYWTIKNSWSEGWGELGYMRLKRTENADGHETCGVAVLGIYPIVEN